MTYYYTGTNKINQLWKLESIISSDIYMNIISSKIITWQSINIIYIICDLNFKILEDGYSKVNIVIDFNHGIQDVISNCIFLKKKDLENNTESYSLGQINISNDLISVNVFPFKKNCYYSFTTSVSCETRG